VEINEIIAFVGRGCEWCDRLVLYEEAVMMQCCGVYLCRECMVEHKCNDCPVCRGFHEKDGDCPEGV